MTVNELNIGEKCLISQFNDPRIEAKLMAMGIFPGRPLELIRRSTLGHTLYIRVDGLLMALRKEEASCIQLK